MMSFLRISYPCANKTALSSDEFFAKYGHKRPNPSGCISKENPALVVAKVPPISTLEDIYETIKANMDPFTIPMVYAFTNRVRVERNVSEMYVPAYTTQTNHLAIDIDDFPELADPENPFDLLALLKRTTAHLHKALPKYFGPDMSAILVASGGMWLSGKELDVTKVKFHIHMITQKPCNMLQIKHLIVNNPEIHGDPAVYSRARQFLCAPPADTNLPTELLDPANRIIYYKGRNAFVTGLDKEPEYVPAPSQASMYESLYIDALNSVYGEQQEKFHNIYQVIRYALSRRRRKYFTSKLKTTVHNQQYSISDNLKNKVIIPLVCELVKAPKAVAPATITRLLTPIIENYIKKYKKTHTVAYYLNDAFKLAFSSVDSLINKDLAPLVTENKSVINITPTPEGYLQLPDTFGTNPLVTYYLQASLGCGKTYSMQKLVESGTFSGPVLYISPLRGLAGEMALKFKLEDYRSESFNRFATDEDGKDFMLQYNNPRKRTTISKGCQGVCVVINSLTKAGINYMIRQGFFSTIIIDEAAASLNNLTGLIKDYAERNSIINNLVAAREFSKHCVIMDGDLNSRVVDIYDKFFDNSWNSEVYTCYTKYLTGVPTFALPTEKAAIAAAIEALREGKRVLMVTDASPEWAETTILLLRAGSPESLVVPYHSEVSSVQGTICNKISNPTQEDSLRKLSKGNSDSNTQFILAEANVQCVVATPSMVSGQDLQGYFDVVISINIASYGLNLRLQAIARERKPKMVMFYCDYSEKKTGIDYYEQFKKAGDLLYYANSLGSDGLDNLPEHIKQQLESYNIGKGDIAGLITLYKNNTHTIEQAMYPLLMRLSLILKGAHIIELDKDDQYVKYLDASYKAVSTPELHEQYKKLQCEAILVNQPNDYTTQDTIDDFRNKICDFYSIGEEELNITIIEDYWNSKPDRKGEQLYKLSLCEEGLLLQTILGILGGSNTNWYSKKKELMRLLTANGYSLSMNGVFLNKADFESFASSLGLGYPTEPSKNKSLIQEGFDHQHLIQHFLRTKPSSNMTSIAPTQTEEVKDI